MTKGVFAKAHRIRKELKNLRRGEGRSFDLTQGESPSRSGRMRDFHHRDALGLYPLEFLLVVIEVKNGTHFLKNVRLPLLIGEHRVSLDRKFVLHGKHVDPRLATLGANA